MKSIAKRVAQKLTTPNSWRIYANQPFTHEEAEQLIGVGAAYDGNGAEFPSKEAALAASQP